MKKNHIICNNGIMFALAFVAVADEEKELREL